MALPFACPRCRLESVGVGLCPSCKVPLSRREAEEKAPAPVEVLEREVESQGLVIALEAQNLCPACGDPLLPDAAACPSCGIALA